MEKHEKYVCPLCGRDYGLPPKWCPCTPYSPGEPDTKYYLVSLQEADNYEELADENFPVLNNDTIEVTELTAEIFDSAIAESRSDQHATATLLFLVRERYIPFIESTDGYFKEITSVSEELYKKIRKSL